MIYAATTIVIFTSIVVFFLVIILLVSVLLSAKAVLTPSGPVKIRINGEKEIEVESGGTLLSTLGDNKIFLPSACGGGGTCVQCRCQVNEGGGEILPTETPHFTGKSKLKTGGLVARLKLNKTWTSRFLKKYLE